jgi:hypothetical protein
VSIIFEAIRYGELGGQCDRCKSDRNHVLVDVGDNKLCEKCLDTAVNLFQQMRDNPQDANITSEYVPGVKK